MAHISSIGAAMFTDLAVAVQDIPLPLDTLAALNTSAEFQSLFSTEIVGGLQGASEVRSANTNIVLSSGAVTATLPNVNTFLRVGDVRTFPAMGTPANIVKVPTYGQSTSKSIQGQSDAPQLELDINFIPKLWARPVAGAFTAASTEPLLGAMVGDGKQYVFRVALLTSKPTLTTPAAYASTVAGLGSIENSQYYWIGKMEALLVTPSLTDAITAKLTMSIQSAFFGAWTI